VYKGDNKMYPTAIILLVFIGFYNIVALLDDSNDRLLSVFASNNNGTFNQTNFPSDGTSTNDSSRLDASCTNFLSVSCRLPSCDIRPMQIGCPLQAGSANSTSINNILRQLQNH
jgi:hypothetical protein